MAKKKLIIVGGGFGGLNCAKALKKSDFEILLIDKKNHHLFQPLLYQVATAALSPGSIAIPIREILRKQENTTVIMGEVIKIDKENRYVTLGNGEKIAYDSIVISTGAMHSYFGKDEWEAYAPGLKTVTDALDIREEILLSFEKAERLESLENIEKHLNFVIIGGGPTGVEMAGAIAEIAKTTLFKNFRRINPEEAKIFLIEALPHILPTYPQKLSKKAQHDLEELGVTVITNKKVTEVNDKGVQVEDLFIESTNIIWAAGNQASKMLQTLNVPLDRAGRVIVEPDLTIPGHPEIFVIGDAAHAKGKDGKPLPGIAPTAIQQGNYVAKTLLTDSPNRKPFKYFDKGYMATIGKKRAVAVVGKLQFSGLIAWLAWSFIHILYLIGFRNRISVMIEWIYHFITGQRGVRLIYSPIDEKIPYFHSD